MLAAMKHLFALTLALLAGSVSAAVIEGRVIEVIDGATITVLSREGASLHRVRVAGIDAPRKGREHEGASRASLRRLTSGKTVRVQTSAIDSKGFLLGTVLVVRDAKECGDQRCEHFEDPGLTQLGYGLAFIDKTNLPLQTSGARERYLSAEALAKANRLGVWRNAQFHVRADQAAR
jgi:endonuclease YncB( thermonuclease family)